MRLFRQFFVLMVFLLSCQPAFAAKEWDIYYPGSTLWFEGTQMGKPFKGSFNIYNATVDFDPNHPELAKVEVNIDMRSAKTGDKERDDTIPQKEWFDTVHYPFAQLYAGKIRKLSDRKFELTGMLTIKELTHDIVMPFTMEDDRDATRIKGEVTINRADFGVGTGTWGNENYVKNAVTIGIDLLAKQKK